MIIVIGKKAIKKMKDEIIEEVRSEMGHRVNNSIRNIRLSVEHLTNTTNEQFLDNIVDRLNKKQIGR